MLVLVVIDKGGDGGVMASGEHSGRCVFLGNWSQLAIETKESEGNFGLHLFS